MRVVATAICVVVTILLVGIPGSVGIISVSFDANGASRLSYRLFISDLRTRLRSGGTTVSDLAVLRQSVQDPQERLHFGESN